MVDYKVVENVKNVDFWRSVCCELVATCMLIFIGCGSIILHIPGTVITTSADIVRIALAFGLSVTVLIRTFGPISGCHINPAVSIGLLSVGRITLVRAVFYVTAQTIGAVLGSVLLFSILPGDKRQNLGLTTLANGVNQWQGLAAEVVLTFVLLLVICACTDENRYDYQTNKSTNPLVIGFTVAVLHLMAIPYTGSSVNPARTFGPALITWFWRYQWIYWSGPILGACLGAITYRALLHHELTLPLAGTAGNDATNKNVNCRAPSTAEVRRQYQRYGMVSVEVPMTSLLSRPSSSASSHSETSSNLNVLEMIKE